MTGGFLSLSRLERQLDRYRPMHPNDYYRHLKGLDGWTLKYLQERRPTVGFDQGVTFLIGTGNVSLHVTLIEGRYKLRLTHHIKGCPEEVREGNNEDLNVGLIEHMMRPYMENPPPLPPRTSGMVEIVRRNKARAEAIDLIKKLRGEEL